MKPKIFVLIALMLAVLVAGLILILGYAKKSLLPLYLILFLLTFFALIIFLIRNILSSKLVIIGSIVLILLAISITLLLTNLKTYYDISYKYNNFENSEEFNQIQSENDYYLAYANYLNQRISEYRNQTKIMEDQLLELKKIELAQLQQETVIPVLIEEIIPVVPEEEYIYYYESNDRDDEKEEEEDD